jgi:NADH-quinone oxidoreductase subunit E
VTLAEQIEQVAAQYPQRRSAILPALRLAQERYGWLSPQALVEVAESLGLTPGYCLSVASFYDMFHLQPVGQRLIEVCTNICCGLRGAQEVLEELERRLGIAAGETTPDGRFTLRAVECLGACAWPTVVAVDHRYHLSVSAQEVETILGSDPSGEALRG